jgi:hypothetical protein
MNFALVALLILFGTHPLPARGESSDPADAALSQAPSGPESGDEDLQARVTRLKGTVYLHLEGRPDDEFIKAELNAPLESGDMVRTGTDGSAELTVDGHTVVQVSPNSDFVVDSLDPEETVFHVGVGKISVMTDTLPPDRHMEFETPLAVAVAGASQFGISYEEGTGSSFAVFGGAPISVRSNGGSEVVLGPNEGMNVPPGGNPAPPNKLKPSAIRGYHVVFLRRRFEYQREHWRVYEWRRWRRFRTRLAHRRRIKARRLAHVRASHRRRTYGHLNKRRAERRHRRHQKKR